MLEWIKDRYLTWRTGKDKETRDWEAWCEVNVVNRASTITNMFMHFKHVIIVNPEVFFDHGEPFGWVPVYDARQYFFPNRPLDETNCVWKFERVTGNQWDNRWHIDEMFGEDKLFVACNNDEDAMMIALKYS